MPSHKPYDSEADYDNDEENDEPENNIMFIEDNRDNQFKPESDSDNVHEQPEQSEEEEKNESPEYEKKFTGKIIGLDSEESESQK